MKVKKIISILDKLAPPFLIDSWDNSGLQIGSVNKDVEKILISLDLSENSLKEAIEKNVDMIITHHPFIFGKLSNISLDDKRGKMIRDIIKADITIFSMHTNLDICEGGVNDILCEKLDINSYKPLSNFFTEKLYKLIAHIPKEGLNEVRKDRMETIVREHKLERTIETMINTYPNYKIEYDVYPLINKGTTYGYGRIGNLEEEMTLEEFANIVNERLECKNLRIYGDLNKDIKNVAVCGGSGAGFIKDALRENADVYVTGDIKYHDAQLALELGLTLLDAGHYETEKPCIDSLKQYISKNTRDLEIFTYKESLARFTTLK